MKKEKTIVEKIYDYSLEEIMADRFGRYSKYIIQDRALPDARDGLKPVQRRILYSMYKDKNTYDRETKKSAKTVGAVIGNYHPHGDTSVYDAMVRLSQNWKQREPLIEIQGNNGSIDGDGPAAMRYTEARLTRLAAVFLRDIEKDSVDMAPTFDDYSLEPTVLPSHFPNLLVNGSTGISAGYATNIPPHNLTEVIDACVKRIDNPECKIETILNIIKGPDFPTGATVEGKKELEDAYKTGKGKVTVTSNYEIIKDKKIHQIVINEIPYDTLKINIIKKIDEIRINKKIDGIIEVRDESDKDTTLRIAIDLKKEANSELIVKYLLKNTDMQVNYSFNMVAIVNRRPKVLNILQLIDAFINHKKDVVIRRSKFDLSRANARLHIVEGFIKAIDILDEVVKTIRKSKDKQDAISNLCKEFSFTEDQATAIVLMQLYKLTNTDVTILKEEKDNLLKQIESLELILSSEDELKRVIKDELKSIKKEFSSPRRTLIKENAEKIEIDEMDMVNKDDYYVSISKRGYIKKMSVKSFATLEGDLPVRDFDYIESIYKLNNINTLIVFTSLGNYLYIPVRNINESKAKDLGEHISSYVKISDDEKLVRSIALNKFDDTIITIFTKNGMTKKILTKDLEVQRYSRALTAIKLKDGDEVINISRCSHEQVVVISKNGYALKFNSNEIPVLGLRTSGVKLMNLKDDEVVGAYNVNPIKEFMFIYTNNGTCKRIRLSEISSLTRAKKGISILKGIKSKKYICTNAMLCSSKTIFNTLGQDNLEIKASDINIMDLSSTGSTYTKKEINDIYEKPHVKDITKVQDEIISEVESKEEIKNEEKTQKGENLTMSDFFDEFKL